MTEMSWLKASSKCSDVPSATLRITPIVWYSLTRAHAQAQAGLATCAYISVMCHELRDFENSLSFWSVAFLMHMVCLHPLWSSLCLGNTTMQQSSLQAIPVMISTGLTPHQLLFTVVVQQHWKWDGSSGHHVHTDLQHFPKHSKYGRRWNALAEKSELQFG